MYGIENATVSVLLLTPIPSPLGEPSPNSTPFLPPYRKSLSEVSACLLLRYSWYYPVCL